MAIKKSELYSSLWKSCDQLRGGMDASQYKDYVLVLLFVKYVSDRYAGQKDALIEVPAGGSFSDMVALKGDKEIGDKLNKIIGRLAEANELKGVIDVADFNDADKLGKGKEMVDRLSDLIATFNTPDLDFRNNRSDGDDILGDAYEYLMRHFATESGKSKGQFYTPAEVSRIMAKVIGVNTAKSADQTIYDPTCGSGSLLLKAHDEARSNTGLNLALYGQENDNATAALAKMNMILHHCPTAEIWKDNVLSSPHFKQSNDTLKTFDFVVSNPPFSTKAWSHGFDPYNDTYNRFNYGIPPTKNGDYAFLLHVLASLKSTGKGAIILPHGVLFRGNAEATIREQLIKRGFIKGIIGLPANLFYGTSIPACIIILDKERADERKGIFMIDASKGFIKDGNKNRLRAQDIHKIVDSFNDQHGLTKFSRFVSLDEIEANAYNLNIPRYIDSAEAEDLQDIEGHLQGGIPDRDINDLERYWKVLPSVRQALFTPANRSGYSQLVQRDNIKNIIFAHPEFNNFNTWVNSLFSEWKNANTWHLTSLDIGSNPKKLIETISETILDAFRIAPLLDPYDIYQHLMSYWVSTMQDDVYMLVQDGWKASIQGQPNIDLIPQEFVIKRYFLSQQQIVDSIEVDRDRITSQVEALCEEHGCEEGLLEDAKNDKGKLTKASVKARLATIKHDSESDDERKLLNEFLDLLDQEAAASKRLKDTQKALEIDVNAKYHTLSESEIKDLVVEDKWLRAIAIGIETELECISQRLTGRIIELTERYTTPLSSLEQEVEFYRLKVGSHLKRMGFDWQAMASEPTGVIA
jgi:type I restriction enzyme M protein